jgi:hypothetical protein
MGWQAENSIIDHEYPYIIKGYTIISSDNYTKYNEKTLDEALKLVSKLTTEIRLDGKVECDKVDVVHNGLIIASFVTEHRIGISDLYGFSINSYDGDFLQSPLVEIDSLNLNKIRKLDILLTNGEEILIETPWYSLQENSIRGLFIKTLYDVYNYPRPKPYCDPPPNRCIPLNIIQRILNIVENK